MRQVSLIQAIPAMALLPTALASSSYFSPLLLARQDGADSEEYLNEVCKPPMMNSRETPVPCVHIEIMEILCAPNGTDPIHYDAHAQCMCGGSFFEEWMACQDCLVVHGLRSEENNDYFEGVLSSVSAELCSGTPTAVFSDIFATIAGGEEAPTGPTSDRFPSDTAVSRYYSPTGSRGTGAITGEAVTATRTGLLTAPRQSETSTTDTTATGTADREETATRDVETTSTTSNPGVLATPAAAVLVGAVLAAL